MAPNPVHFQHPEVRIRLFIHWQKNVGTPWCQGRSAPYCSPVVEEPEKVDCPACIKLLAEQVQRTLSPSHG